LGETGTEIFLEKGLDSRVAKLPDLQINGGFHSHAL
jgi:hypothetical protein